MRIVQLANFIAPQSGGIRTTLQQLGRGYLAAGHQPVLILPGPRDTDEVTPSGRVIQLRSSLLPGSGGYRLLTDLRRVGRVLEALEPDRLEVSDQLTLRRLGRWAAARGVPSIVLCHERIDALAREHLPCWLPAPTATTARMARMLAASFGAVVAPSRWALEPFRGLAADAHVVPLGVDLEQFHPCRRSPALRRALCEGDERLLAHVGRLSKEKRPELAIETLRKLHRRGARVRLVVAGDGPLRGQLTQQAAGLPVSFLGFLSGRAHLAELLATADVTVCTGAVETFGLAALESLACGTPIVCARTGAVGELLGASARAGEATWSHPAALAAAARRVLDVDELARRRAARGRAVRYPWSRTVERMLAIHRVGGPQPAAAVRAVPA
ncbi:glycosyltransferase family 1 protein [soil metagenome]|jgi:alpha-1,6-mannosyltransferase